MNWSTGFLLVNVWYILIIPLILNKQIKNHSEAFCMGFPLILLLIFLPILTGFLKVFFLPFLFM